MSCKISLAVVGAGLLSVSLAGCGSKTEDGTTIKATGSDTMVNVAQAWAEEYAKQNPKIKVNVNGGGSGRGISSLINGTCDMANASRKMKDKEKAACKEKQGKAPVEHVVGFDALAVYVHKDNPLDSISIGELAEIYGDGGTTENWLQVSDAAAGLDKIVRVSRQNNSGTYVYFREAVLGKERDYKLGSVDQSGSKDVVALVARTPGAIGYSGMGYATDEVKMLKISAKKGEPGVAPTVDNAKSGAYPITRPLHIYTAGAPTGTVKQYIEWILSKAGQQVVTDLGYVPVK